VPPRLRSFSTSFIRLSPDAYSTVANAALRSDVASSPKHVNICISNGSTIIQYSSVSALASAYKLQFMALSSSMTVATALAIQCRVQQSEATIKPFLCEFCQQRKSLTAVFLKQTAASLHDCSDSLCHMRQLTFHSFGVCIKLCSCNVVSYTQLFF
jgi:hypothetical protein